MIRKRHGCRGFRAHLRRKGLRHAHIQAQLPLIADAEQFRAGATAGGDEPAHVGVTGGDDAIEGRDNALEARQVAQSLQIRARGLQLRLAGIREARLFIGILARTPSRFCAATPSAQR